MDDLQELVAILSKATEFRPEILRARPGWTDEFERFFTKIAGHSYRSDTEAFYDLYGAGANKNRYYILKSRLRKKLLNSIFLLEIHEPRYSKPSEAYFRVHQLLFLSHILERFSGGTLKTTLAEDGLAIAEEYELTLPQVSFLTLLCRDASFRGLKQRYKLYEKKLRQANKIHHAETVVVGLYQRLAIQFAKTTSNRPELIEASLRCEAKASALLRSGTSYSLLFYVYRIRMLSAQIVQDYRAGLRVADEAATFLKSRPELLVPTRLGEFLTYKLLGYLHLRMYEEGKLTAEECEQVFRHGSIPWFIFREYYFLLAMHTERYEEAKALYDETTQHDSFSILPDDRKERWKIYELYVDYILRLTGSPLAKPKRGPKALSLKKLLREVPTYARDKQGYNISVLVIHILYLLEQHDFDAITVRMEALKSYRLRYLQPKTKRQSAVFFKMLLIMERESFDYDRTLRYTEPYFDRLQETPSDYSEYEEGLQILPFDWLWPHILESLRKER